MNRVSEGGEGMQERKTFHGPTWRVQIQVFDYSDGAIAAWKDKPTTFAVTRLAQRHHRSTPFSAGTQTYYGENIKEAVGCVSSMVRHDISHELPKGWEKYSK